MLAFAMLATIRRRANAPPPKTPIRLIRNPGDRLFGPEDSGVE
jgi:hypothetical protein